VNTSILLNLWKHECKRVIADRFTNQTDKDWFEKAVRTVVEEDIGSEMAEGIQDDHYFVDFMRDAPEITGTAFEVCYSMFFECENNCLKKGRYERMFWCSFSSCFQQVMNLRTWTLKLQKFMNPLAPLTTSRND
jgi:hypothetical protein